MAQHRLAYPIAKEIRAPAPTAARRSRRLVRPSQRELVEASLLRLPSATGR